MASTPSRNSLLLPVFSPPLPSTLDSPSSTRSSASESSGIPRPPRQSLSSATSPSPSSILIRRLPRSLLSASPVFLLPVLSRSRFSKIQKQRYDFLLILSPPSLSRFFYIL